MASLTAYRTRIINSLDDSTLKYSNDIIDEALRKVLNEYTRAFPNIKTTSVTIATAERSQTLTACANLMAIIQLYHPYNSALSDPFINPREDFALTWQDGIPFAFFTGDDIPQVTEKIFVKYAAKQTIDTLDSATATTVRDDHEDLLIVGAAGQAAMIRASGLTEKWGTLPNQQSNLLIWGKSQYQRFIDFLMEIRSEQPIDIFPDTFWKLDQWDRG
ncbi:MAG: hypothetical protein Q8N39_08140 [Pelolinea sp.]|nr:hypothetical protein [Pelolinea sp.]